MRKASGTRIPDAASGFRAFHRNAALQIYVFNEFTYTLETIIQAGRKNIPVTSVPIRVNGETRPSRLFRSTPEYVWRSVKTILRIATLYRPLKTFILLAALIALPGILAITALPLVLRDRRRRRPYPVARDRRRAAVDLGDRRDGRPDRRPRRRQPDAAGRHQGKADADISAIGTENRAGVRWSLTMFSNSWSGRPPAPARCHRAPDAAVPPRRRRNG